MKLASCMALCLALASPAVAEKQLIPVPGAVIYAGQPMEEAALADKLFNVPEASAGKFVVSREQLKGLFAKRALLPGRPIALSHLKPREAVVQGTLTRATYTNAGVSITTFLVPLQAGAVGDIIDARNPQAGSIVKARVGEDGSLLVGP
jgi:flagella basal body P-ring formation protein FlgA